MEKKKNCVKDIYVWLDGGRQKACSVKCSNDDIQTLLTSLEGKFGKMFTYGESYKVFYGESSFEESLKYSISKIEKLLQKKEAGNLPEEKKLRVKILDK